VGHESDNSDVVLELDIDIFEELEKLVDSRDAVSCTSPRDFHSNTFILERSKILQPDCSALLRIFGPSSA